MPCDSVVLNKIEIAAANLDLLIKALQSLSLAEQSLLLSGGAEARARQIIREGFIRLPAGQEYLADRIKQEYSRQAVQATARKFGWRVSQKTPQKMTVTRRA